jgi:membrane-associated phospholipid phosphatase
MGEHLARSESIERARHFHWRWGRVSIAAALCALGFFIFRGYDMRIGLWREGFMPFKEDGFADQIFEGFKNFAQPLTIASIAVFVGLMSKRRKRILVALLVAQLGAMLTYNVVKLTVARDRPYVVLEKVESRRGGVGGRFVGSALSSGQYQHGTIKSFPSGHTAAAFALAGVLAWFFPKAAPLFWFLAIGCGFSRVIDAAHWPTDCVVGAGIGYLWSQLGLRILR